MKKVLTLSALGCVATVGALFATFTLDPTNISDEILAENVEVDLDKHIFSEFTLLEPDEEIEFELPRARVGEETVAVTFDRPKFKYDLKDVYDQYGHDVGSNLDLECLSYSAKQLDRYIAIKGGQMKGEEENPRGYAFRYRYEQKFLDRCKLTLPEDFTASDLNYYALYKTSFKGGVSNSNLANDKISDLGVHYRGGIQPDSDSPVYNNLAWDKTPQSVILDLKEDKQIRTDDFIIKPDYDINGNLLSSGYVIFNGDGFTTNLFEGYFDCSFDDVKDLEEYLKNAVVEGSGEHAGEPVKNFRNRIKVYEYSKPTTYELDEKITEEGMILHDNFDDGDLLVPNDRYKFEMTVDSNIEKSFKENNASITDFAIYHVEPSEDPDEEFIVNPVQLISNNQPEGETYTPEELLDLTVTKTDKNGDHDVSSLFSYDNDPESVTYNHIVCNIPSQTSNVLAPNYDAYVLHEGEILSIEFTFRKSFAGYVGEKVPWDVAYLHIDGLLDDTIKYELAYDAGESSEGSYMCYDYTTEQISSSLAPEEECVISIPVDDTSYVIDEVGAEINTGEELPVRSQLLYYVGYVRFVDSEGEQVGDELSPNDYYCDTETDSGKLLFPNMDYLYNKYNVEVGMSLEIELFNYTDTAIKFSTIYAYADIIEEEFLLPGEFDSNTLSYVFGEEEATYTISKDESIRFMIDYNSTIAPKFDLSKFVILGADGNPMPLDVYDGLYIYISDKTNGQIIDLSVDKDFGISLDTTEISFSPDLKEKISYESYIAVDYHNRSETDITIKGARLSYANPIGEFGDFVESGATAKGGPIGSCTLQTSTSKTANFGEDYQFTALFGDSFITKILGAIGQEYNRPDEGRKFDSDFTFKLYNDEAEVDLSNVSFSVIAKTLPLDEFGNTQCSDLSHYFEIDTTKNCIKVKEELKKEFFNAKYLAMDQACFRITFNGSDTDPKPVFNKAVIDITSVDRA